tara:strand:+ start:69 stop:284 length:216 start_codon:yes stop_codon:yes gene_type:complete
MNILKLVERLEAIERESDGKSLKMLSELIDDLIKFDMETSKEYKKFSREVADGMMTMLFEEGIASGSIGEA